MASCEPPFWKHVGILFHPFSLEYKPTCEHAPWNFLVRIVILSLFIGLIASAAVGLPALLVSLLFGLITAIVIIYLTPSTEKKIPVTSPSGTPLNDFHSVPYVSHPGKGVQAPIKEHFVNGAESGAQPMDSFQGQIEIDAHPYSGPSLPDYTPPTSRNPFMNLLVDEYKYNPQRPEAAPVDHSTVKQTMDDFFRVQWFSDPTDVFGKNQGQRQFVTQPSTTVPNDQGTFADWLYRIPGKTCKEGGREACHGQADSPAPWLSH